MEAVELAVIQDVVGTGDFVVLSARLENKVDYVKSAKPGVSPIRQMFDMVEPWEVELIPVGIWHSGEVRILLLNTRKANVIQERLQQNRSVHSFSFSIHSDRIEIAFEFQHYQPLLLG